MDKYEVAKELMRCFPNSFINADGEFVAHRDANEYFILENCNSVLDVECKVLEWFSRAAFKTEPFPTKAKNDRFHKFMRGGINKFLGTNFTAEDMELIYTRLGNGINRPLCERLVDFEYSMDVLKGVTSNDKI